MSNFKQHICPECSNPLEIVDYYQSIPCHFSYSEEASDFSTGIIYECVNPNCLEYGAQFHAADDNPEVLIEGTPYGG